MKQYSKTNKKYKYTNTRKFNYTKKHSNKNNKKQIEYYKSLEYPYYNIEYKLVIPRIYNLVSYLNLKLIEPSTISEVHFKKLNPLSNRILYIINAPWTENIELNNLTDFFSEKCRVACQFLGNPIPLNYWKNNKTSIISSTLKTYQSLSTYYLREIIYSKTRLCNNFRISVALTVLKLISPRPKRWLDISAGWGDRLISAILSPNIEFYCGVDPNPCLHPIYQKMVDTLKQPMKKPQAQYILLKDGFEAAVLPKNQTYDLVFSSPPFFDLETYSSATSNSITSYKTETSWYDHFLIASINKSISYLESKGHLILYMGDSKTAKYVDKMIHDIPRLNPEMKPKGSIFYVDGSTYRNFLVWQKD